MPESQPPVAFGAGDSYNLTGDERGHCPIRTFFKLESGKMNTNTKKPGSTTHSKTKRKSGLGGTHSVFFLIIISLLLLTAPVSAAIYYLDAVNGNDSNDGTSDFPWKTLAKAQSTIADGDTVNLRTGDYGNFIENNISHARWTTYQADTGHTPTFSQEAPYDDAIRVYSNSGKKNVNLIFRGITIYHSGALIRNVAGVKIDGCNFVGPGYSMEVPYNVTALNLNYGIQLHTATGIVIDGCSINGDGDNFDSYVGYDDSVRVSVTKGSPIVTGRNTTWTNAQVGKYFSCLYNIKYTVVSVQSNTQLTLTTNYAEETHASRLWGTTGPYEGTIGGIQGNEGGYGTGYGRGIFFLDACQNVVINNCNIGGCDTAISGAGNSGITISNNEIHHTTFDAITITGSNPTESGFSDPVIIEDNHIHDGIDMYLGRTYSNGTPVLNDFAHNDFIQGMAADDIKYELNNLIIRNNHLHHSDGDAMFLRGGYTSGYYNRNWVIENNLVYDMGLRHANINALPMVVLHNVDGCIFRNNTLLCGKLLTKKDSGAGKPVKFTQCTGNIIDIMAANVLQSGDGYTEFVYENYNIINQIAYGSHTIDWGKNTILFNPYRKNPVSHAQFRALFTDYETADFTHASANSLGVGHGDPAKAPLKDIHGKVRDTRPDAGCYEYGADPVPPPDEEENLDDSGTVAPIDSSTVAPIDSDTVVPIEVIADSSEAPNTTPASMTVTINPDHTLVITDSAGKQHTVSTSPSDNGSVSSQKGIKKPFGDQQYSSLLRKLKSATKNQSSSVWTDSAIQKFVVEEYGHNISRYNINRLKRDLNK